MCSDNNNKSGFKELSSNRTPLKTMYNDGKRKEKKSNWTVTNTDPQHSRRRSIATRTVLWLAQGDRPPSSRVNGRLNPPDVETDCRTCPFLLESLEAEDRRRLV